MGENKGEADTQEIEIPPAHPEGKASEPSADPPAQHHLEVLILGGGFAGVYCARELVKQPAYKVRKGEPSKVGIIASENYMVFQPMLPEVVGGSLSPRHVVNPIRRLCKDADVYRGDVQSIDLEKKTLIVDGGDFVGTIKFSFNKLVLAMGAIVDLSRIPGMAEHAFLLRNVGDAMKLRAAIINRMEEANLEADHESQKRLLTFVVVGGGYSGVETAGQLLDLLLDVQKEFEYIRREDIRVALVHSGQHLLPTLSPKLGDYCRDRLADRGIKMLMPHRVKAVTANKVFLEDGAVLTTNMVICTVGNGPHPVILDIISKFGLPGEKGRLLTDEFCRVKGSKDLWAAGDCAGVPMPEAKPGALSPATAQFAMRQGALLAKNIAAEAEGKPLQAFSFTGLGELAAIGHRKAVADIMGMQFHGFIAWFMWRTIYLAKLPGLERKVRVMMEWSLELVFPRDINMLSPRYTRSLDEIHLEPGDPVFGAGEPAFSFYMVKSGAVEIADTDGHRVKLCGPGDHFGERALLTDQIWRFNAKATEPTTLMSISGNVFRQLVSGSGGFERMLKRTAKTYQTHDEMTALLAKVPEATRHQKVSSIMSTEVISLNDAMTVDEALVIMRSQPHSHYPVVNEENKLVGFLERNDFYHSLKSSDIHGTTTLRHFELEPPTQVTTDCTVQELVERLIRGGHTKLCVVDSDGRLAGMATVMDLLGRGSRSQAA
jgi:NADH dehydrogenase